MNFFRVLTNGIIKENPIFRLLLGMCATLAVSTQAINGVGMGLATSVVLIGSNVMISLLRNVIPSKVRIPCYIVVIATFVTLVQMILEAYVPALYSALGVFIPLIVVNCVILGRAEAFAAKNNVLMSLADGIGMGLGFTLSLAVLGSIRELIGFGSIFGISVLGTAYQPMLLIILPPGAFLVLGILMGLLNKVQEKKKA